MLKLVKQYKGGTDVSNKIEGLEQAIGRLVALSEDAVKRLNVMVNLLLEQSPKGETQSMADKICKLKELGLNSPEIAKILCKELNYVTATLSQRKKAKTVKRRK